MKQHRTRALLVCATLVLLAAHARAQTPAPVAPTTQTHAATTTQTHAAATATTTTPASDDEDVRLQLRQQREEIERLQTMLREQMRQLEDLRARVEGAETRPPASTTLDVSTPAASTRLAIFNDTLRADAATAAARTSSTAPETAAQGATVDERLKKLEDQAKRTSEAVSRQLGPLTFSGDIRFRYESIYGQLNSQPSSDNPAAFGNPLSSRQRFRLRARLAARAQLSPQFEMGFRLATGSYPDVNSSNQTLTDFFSHKNFALEQAYVTYKPARLPGFQVQAGKFEVPWLRTELTIDNDINPEGMNESYTRNFKDSAVKSLTFVAWQLPFLERASAFVLGPDGRVNLEQSRRNGRDLALFGAQLRTRIEPTSHTALTLSAADLFFSGTQFITPAQFLGPNVQFPVTVQIPATNNTPAQTVTTQVSIPRELFVSGNANLGVSTATNNAINRDGRLASGFNLVDLIARLDLTHSKRWPTMLLFNYVVNTQAHDFLAAASGNTSRLVENDEDSGFWAELQVGKTQQRGDWLFNYTFMQLEKDAVLSPFNFSDVAQQTDSRMHRFIVAYAADPRVTLSLTGIVTQRLHGLLGVFGSTPPGSLNRATTRLQLDTIFRF